MCVSEGWLRVMCACVWGGYVGMSCVCMSACMCVGECVL